RPFDDGRLSHIWAALQVDDLDAGAEAASHDGQEVPAAVELIKPVYAPVNIDPFTYPVGPSRPTFIDRPGGAASALGTIGDASSRSTVNQPAATVFRKPVARLVQNPWPVPVSQREQHDIRASDRQIFATEISGFAGQTSAGLDPMFDISATFVPVTLDTADYGGDLSWDKPVGAEVRPLPRPQLTAADGVVFDPHQLVIGSLRDRSMADQLSSRFNSYFSHVVTVEVDGDKWHRVVIDTDSIYLAKLLKRQVGKVDGRRPWIRSNAS
ncbi:MAG: hypothetical protein VW057_05570, partial [Rhodospirillaceae bacterium]